jgi:hypothetical protein
MAAGSSEMNEFAVVRPKRPKSRDLLVGERPYFLAVDRKGAEHRLRREILQQCDLPFGERTYFLTACGNMTKQCAVLAQWHHQNGAETSFLRNLSGTVGHLR